MPQSPESAWCIGLTFDLIEPVCPDAEAFVFDLLASRAFRKSEFVETSDGHVRLLGSVAHERAEAMPGGRDSSPPYAHGEARRLHRFRTRIRS